MTLTIHNGVLFRREMLYQCRIRLLMSLMLFTSYIFLQPDNALPSVDQPPPISSQIELQVVDLISLTRVGKPLTGHRGFTPSEKAFYLYADVSDSFVGSGSEDGRGCLWDRHYRSLVRDFKS